MKPAVYVSIAMLGILTSMNVVHAEMYKWTDKNGKTHYTATPPPADAQGKNIEDDIKLSTGKLGNVIPQNTTSAAEPKSDMDKAAEEGKKSEEKHRDFCQQQSAALKQMTANALIKWKDDQGERFLTAEEKTQKMKEMEKNISSMCRPEMFKDSPDRQTSATEKAMDERLSGEKDEGINAASTTGTGSANTASSDAGTGSVAQEGAATKSIPAAN